MGFQVPTKQPEFPSFKLVSSRASLKVVLRTTSSSSDSLNLKEPLVFSVGEVEERKLCFQKKMMN